MKIKTMIQSILACALFTTIFAFTHESNNSAKDPLAGSPLVGKLTNTPNGSLISCNLKALKDTVNFPLSYLTDQIEIVKLDNRDEALIGEKWMRTKISDNYILTSNQKQSPYKLFTRKGKFITNIGSYGQGPNEYLNTYSEQLDETNNRIYILPWQSNKLLVFDLKGNPQPSIPLCLRVPKGQFRVDTAKGEVTVTALPFEGLPAVVWTQDMKGNRKNFIAPGATRVPRDFSNEVMMNNNTSAYEVMLMVIMPPRIDSLYHYNTDKNRLEARFTVQYPGKEIPWHGYSELPGYFVGDVSSPIQVSDNTWVGSKPAYYMVDKKTLRGNYVRLYNDFLGTTSMGVSPAYSFSNGYYINNTEPLALKELLEKEITKKGISPQAKKRAQELIKTLNENDNNVVLIAKLKK